MSNIFFEGRHKTGPACGRLSYKVTQVSEVNQPFAGAALVAVRNQWSEDLVDIIVDNVGCGRPQGPPLQGITALPKLE